MVVGAGSPHRVLARGRRLLSRAGLWKPVKPTDDRIDATSVPASAAARLFGEDPDRSPGRPALGSLWPRLVSWLAWIERARHGPHGACVIVHPWESGMDNSPSWDQPLSVVPGSDERAPRTAGRRHVSADQRPSTREYRQYLGIVEALRARWAGTPNAKPPTARSPSRTLFYARSPPGGERPRHGCQLAGLDGYPSGSGGHDHRAGLAALWDDELGLVPPIRCPHSHRSVGPATSVGLCAVHGRCRGRARPMLERVDTWRRLFPGSIPTTDPDDPAFDPIRYWRGPVWVLVNWLVAEGLILVVMRSGPPSLRTATRALVEQGYSEYYDPVPRSGSAGMASPGAPPSPWPGSPGRAGRRPVQRRFRRWGDPISRGQPDRVGRLVRLVAASRCGKNQGADHGIDE